MLSVIKFFSFIGTCSWHGSDSLVEEYLVVESLNFDLSFRGLKSKFKIILWEE